MAGISSSREHALPVEETCTDIYIEKAEVFPDHHIQERETFHFCGQERRREGRERDRGIFSSALQCAPCLSPCRQNALPCPCPPSSSPFFPRQTGRQQETVSPSPRQHAMPAMPLLCLKDLSAYHAAMPKQSSYMPAYAQLLLFFFFLSSSERRIQNF